MDYNIYLDAVKTLLAGVNPYVHLLNYPGPNNYPPTAFLFFIFFQNKFLFDIFSFLSFFLSIYLLTKKRFFVSCSLFLASLFLFFPLKFNYGMGQINNFILLFCVLAYYYSPAFLSFAVGIKLVPGIYLFYYFIKKDYKKILITILWLLLLFVLSLFLVPWNFQKVYFSDVLWRAFADGGKEVYYNQSLAGFLSRSNLLPLLYPVSIFILFITWFKGRKLNNDRIFAVVTCLLLMLNPIAWQHHFVFAIVPIILLYPLNKILVLLAFTLIAWNFKQPNLISKDLSLLLSHQFFGVFILWVLALWDKKAHKVIGYVWIVSITLLYVLSLVSNCRAC